MHNFSFKWDNCCFFLRETRRKYIRQKYENHKFASNHLINKNNEINNLLKYFQEKDQKIIFDSLLKLFSYNHNILAPIESDVRDNEIIDFKKFFITII